MKDAPFYKTAARCALLAFALGMIAPSAYAAMGIVEAVERAAQRDYAYIAAKARRAAEMESGEQLRSDLRPQVELGGAGYYARTNSTFAYGSAQDTYPSWEGYLRARQALLRFDWATRKDNADTLDALAGETFGDETTQFISRVTLRYLETLIAEEAYRQAGAETRAVAESLSDTVKRYEVELVPGVDVKEARARNDLASARLVSARAELEDRRDALQELTGYDRSPLPQMKDSQAIPPLNPDTAEAWIKLAETQSAAIRRAEVQRVLAESEYKLRRAERYPTADLVVEGSHFDALKYESQGVSLGARQHDARIGIEFKVPIYAGGQRASRIREARAKRDEAVANHERIKRESTREIQTLYRAVETAKAEAVAYSQVLVSAEAALRATQAGYDAGTRTITDVLDAKKNLVTATRQRNEARLLVLLQMLNLNAAAGELTIDTIRGVESLFLLGPATELAAERNR